LKIFVTGGAGGVGSAVVQHLSRDHQVTAPDRSQLDLLDFDAIANLDLSGYDVIINCAAANAGAYLGWHDNSCDNQARQVDVNFTAALLLVKQYTGQRKTGQFVYVTSTNVDDPIAYNIFYTAAKAALRYSIGAIKKDFPNIVFTEICPGKIKTRMLEQNYQGTKTTQEIEELYAKGPCLKTEDIVRVIDQAIKYKLDHITISPHE
jgi:NAD(P)-dependent dehydrogenase (short-subunit alcohol dehydrogenase family)